jgi:hypothetical protein
MGALDALVDLIGYMTTEEVAELEEITTAYTPVWCPLPGPQLRAYESEADVLFYGGAAGGGKSDMLIGTALTQHKRSIIFRRVGTELQAITDRMGEILGSDKGYNGQKNIWKLPGRQVEFGATPTVGDEKKYQGRPHDLKCFDEITNFMESQFRFLITWMRTTIKGQRCRVICTGNPPVDSDGEWVVNYWAPWLDPLHPNPAKEGELRWYVAVDGKDIEVPDNSPYPDPEKDGKFLTPQSRTFIRSKVTDNDFLMETGYEATLQMLPEPLRSQMLNGDFAAGKEENVWQVIPSAWVEAAQARWSEHGKQTPMDSIGEDVARGGKCETVISRRHGVWFDKLLCYPGAATPDGPSAGAVALAAVRDGAPIHVDVIGVGTSPYDHLVGVGAHAVPINGAESAQADIDKTGQLRFYNKRALLWWKMRERLDPSTVPPCSLPPGQDIKADLCAPRWALKAGKILVESKDELVGRLGRSPDKGDAIVYGNVETPKRVACGENWRNKAKKG